MGMSIGVMMSHRAEMGSHAGWRASLRVARHLKCPQWAEGDTLYQEIPVLPSRVM